LAPNTPDLLVHEPPDYKASVPMGHDLEAKVGVGLLF
jgi:hypothetical protein